MTSENESGVKVPHNQINYNSVAGSLGLASFLGLNAGGLFNKNCGGGGSLGEMSTFAQTLENVRHDFVTQKEMDYEHKILQQTGENSILVANKYADEHIIEAYKDTVARFKESDEKLQSAIQENMNARILNDKEISLLQAKIQCLEERLKMVNDNTNQKLDYEVQGVYREIGNAKNELRGAVALESERRECGDKNLFNYVNATFVPGKMIMPADSICPKPMPQYNSWTAPTE